MNVDELVVITYPRHIFITCLVIREAIKHQHWNKPVTVIYDDMFAPRYRTYQLDLQVQINKYNSNIELNFIPFSKLKCLNHNTIIKQPMKYGWIRQQLIKLYLDELLNTDNWFVLDGDCVLMENIPCNVNLYPQSYIQDSLSAAFQGYWNYMYGKEVVISTPHPSNPVPVRCVDRNTLTELKQHMSTIHKKSFDAIHHDLLDQNKLIGECDVVMSEWDLIEYYRRQKYNESIAVEIINLCNKNVKFGEDKIIIKTLYGSDADLGAKWFRDNVMVGTDETYRIILKNWIKVDSPEYGMVIENWNKECSQ